MAQLWGGRFTKETDQKVYDFNASIGFDKRLFDVDIEGSKAHEKMLSKVGILTDDEKDAIGEVANISMGTSATTLYSLVPSQKI